MSILKTTAAQIWNCYAQIEEGKKMLQAMRDELEKTGEIKPTDQWNSRRGIEMGIPDNHGGHRILNVEPSLAIDVIEAHIKNMKSELKRWNEKARIELKLTVKD